MEANTKWQRIAKAYFEGMPVKQISESESVTERTVMNIVHRLIFNDQTVPLFKGRFETPVMTDNVLNHISYYYKKKPSTLIKEAREQLIEDGVCTPNNVPSRQVIITFLSTIINIIYKLF